MDISKLNQIKTSQLLKAAGLLILAVVVLVVLFRLVVSTVNMNGRYGSMTQSVSYKGMAPAMDYDMAEESAYGLSTRNIMPVPDEPTMGDDAEDFEITEYNASIETRHLKDACVKVAGLKAKDYVIFENSNSYDRGCNYYFKVKRENVDEILAFIKQMDPRDFSENTRTIKALVDDYTSEADILQKKLDSLDATLEKAITAYDEVTELATRVENAESLAKIIDSKVNVIERLTQERININAQLERISRSKAQQLDRLEYTYFRVNITENKFVDGEALKDSWKYAVKNFVRDMNQIGQDLTINLVKLFAQIFLYGLYVLIVVFVAKYGWRLAKYIWKK